MLLKLKILLLILGLSGIASITIDIGTILMMLMISSLIFLSVVLFLHVSFVLWGNYRKLML